MKKLTYETQIDLVNHILDQDLLGVQNKMFTKVLIFKDFQIIVNLIDYRAMIKLNDELTIHSGEFNLDIVRIFFNIYAYREMSKLLKVD